MRNLNDIPNILELIVRAQSTQEAIEIGDIIIKPIKAWTSTDGKPKDPEL